MVSPSMRLRSAGAGAGAALTGGWVVMHSTALPGREANSPGPHDTTSQQTHPSPRERASKHCSASVTVHVPWRTTRGRACRRGQRCRSSSSSSSSSSSRRGCSAPRAGRPPAAAPRSPPPPPPPEGDTRYSYCVLLPRYCTINGRSSRSMHTSSTRSLVQLYNNSNNYTYHYDYHNSKLVRPYTRTVL